MKPLISIIIPIYNASGYLPRCLDSLVKQTYQNIEIICVNDGSKDDSLKIIEQYAKNNPNIICISQKNSGPATARNAGLDKAQGVFITFCDADDWYEPNMCEIMIKVMLEKDTDFVRCGTFINEEIYNKMGRDKIRYINKSELNCGYILLDNDNRSDIDVNLWNKMFKKNIIDLLNIRFPDGYEHDDTSFSFQYLCASDSCFLIQKKLYHHTIRENSVMDRTYSKKSIKKKFDNLYSMEHFVDFVIKNQLMTKTAKFVLHQLYLRIRFFDWFFLSNNGEKLIELRHCSKILKKIRFSTVVKEGNFLIILIYLKRFSFVKLFLDKNPLVFSLFYFLLIFGKIINTLNPITYFFKSVERTRNINQEKKDLKNLISSLKEQLSGRDDSY